MSKPAALPLFGDAYLADTTHLTTEEHGTYLLLMIAAWRQPDCSLPLDDRKLARIAGLSAKKWASVKETIMEFWTVENERIFQARLRKEHTYVCQKSEANRKSAEARWNKQGIEKQQSDGCERISEGNAPPPPPIGDNTNVSSPSAQAREPKAKKQPETKFRMQPDWQPAPLPATVSELTDLWPDGRLAREIDQFRDYWLDRTDKRPGWDRSFHNRIRDIHDRVMRENRNGNGNYHQPEPELNPILKATVKRRTARAGGQSGLFE